MYHYKTLRKCCGFLLTLIHFYARVFIYANNFYNIELFQRMKYDSRVGLFTQVS